MHAKVIHVYFYTRDGTCNLQADFSRQSQVIPVQNFFSGSLGLIGNTVYDILDFNNVTGNVDVNATSWTVDCGTIPQATLSGQCEGAIMDNVTQWCIEVSPDDAEGGNGLNAAMYLNFPIIGRSTELLALYVLMA